jgi:hypothetical protein
MQRVIVLRILFDKNVPVGVRRFLSAHGMIEMPCRQNQNFDRRRGKK